MILLPLKMMIILLCLRKLIVKKFIFLGKKGGHDFIASSFSGLERDRTLDHTNEKHALIPAEQRSQIKCGVVQVQLRCTTAVYIYAELHKLILLVALYSAGFRTTD